jgi:hydrogenase maturation protein HypF
LFDAVAALIGVRQTVNYEAQAAIELEALVDPAEEGYYEIRIENGVVDPTEMIRDLINEQRAGVSVPTLAARFHNSLAKMSLQTCVYLRDKFGIDEVVLSGGVWQNITLLAKTTTLLLENGLQVYLHRNVPANDGGLALGQGMIAAWRLQNGE